jgi:hypothetical protein
MGAAVYVMGLAIALALTYRAGSTFQKLLHRKTGVGLVGFDRELTERYAREPGVALRESVFTRAWKVVFSKHEDAEVEQARRKYALCVLATAAFALFGLVLL